MGSPAGPETKAGRGLESQREDLPGAGSPPVNRTQTMYGLRQGSSGVRLSGCKGGRGACYGASLKLLTREGINLSEDSRTTTTTTTTESLSFKDKLLSRDTNEVPGT